MSLGTARAAKCNALLCTSHLELLQNLSSQNLLSEVVAPLHNARQQFLAQVKEAFTQLVP